jgi:hypothetical protein
MESGLRQVVYTSRATEPMSPDVLADILKISRLNNFASDITGMLLYRRGQFLQVLEGLQEPLGVLLEKLMRDPRHADFRVLLDTPLAARAFGAWSMAFQDLDGLDPAEMPAYSPFLTQGFTGVECVRYPQKALRMVLAFRDANLATRV